MGDLWAVDWRCGCALDGRLGRSRSDGPVKDGVGRFPPVVLAGVVPLTIRVKGRKPHQRR